MEPSNFPTSSTPPPPLSSADSETIEPTLPAAVTTPQQNARHSFGARRSSSNLATAIPPPLPTIAASPSSPETEELDKGKADTDSTIQPTPTHSRSGSQISNVAQHRMSIAPSLARNSLISQYSPVIEQATEVPVPHRAQDTSSVIRPLGQTPYRQASISDISQAHASSTMPAKPLYKSNVDQNISVEKMRQSTNELASLLSDMKALRRASLSHAASKPETVSGKGGRSGLSHSSPLPSVATFSDKDGLRPPTPPEKQRGFAVSSIAPPSLDATTESRDQRGNEPIATEPTLSSLNPSALPTVTGSGVVSRTAGTSPQYNKELPLPPTRPESFDKEQDSSQSREAVSSSSISPRPLIIPQFPLPQPPPKSGLRQSQVLDETEARPIRFNTNEIATGWEAPRSDDGSTSSGEETHVPAHFPPAPAAPTFQGARQHSFSANRTNPPPHIKSTAQPLVLSKSSTTEGSSQSPSDFRTAPSSPQKAAISQSSIYYRPATQADFNFANLEGPPVPPFASAKSDQIQDSSNESFLTAKSYDGESDDGIPPTDRGFPDSPDLAPQSADHLQPELQSPFRAGGVSSSQSPGQLTSPGVEYTSNTQASSQDTSPLKIHQTYPSAPSSGKYSSLGVLDSRSTFRPQPPVDLGDIRALSQTGPSPGIFYDGSSSSNSEAGGRTVVETQPPIPYDRPALAATNAEGVPITSTIGTEEKLRKKSKGFNYVATDMNDTENLAPTAATAWMPARRYKQSTTSRKSSRRIASTGSAPDVITENSQSMLPKGFPHRQSREAGLDSKPISRHGSGLNAKRHSTTTTTNPTTPGGTTSANPTSKKRPFSQPNIQKLMDMSQAAFKLEDIDMPPTEKVLIEKFVNSLAKLSADINDDPHKRPEGIRRLHNALRAIEGWI